jgi:hypothetical protein
MRINFLLLLLFLQSSGISSSNLASSEYSEASPEYSDFPATSAADYMDYYGGRLPILGAAARRAWWPRRNFQGTVSTDRENFS